MWESKSQNYIYIKKVLMWRHKEKADKRKVLINSPAIKIWSQYMDVNQTESMFYLQVT